MIKKTKNSLLWKAGKKTRSLILAMGLLSGLATAQSYPAIDRGSNCYECAPDGWQLITATPDMLLNDGDYIDNGIRVYGISGASPQGGRFAHLGWVRMGATVQERIRTTITGLTNGKKYNVKFYAQGARFTGGNPYGGGKLDILINGTLIASPLFPEPEWNTDTWREIVVQFTATGSTATLELAGAEQENVNNRRGSVLVDGGGPGSVVEALPNGDLEMVKVINNINGNATIPNPAVVNAGNAVEFEIRIKNNGPNDMNGIKVKDLIPDGYSYLNHATIDGTYNSTTGIWDVGGSPSGGVPNGWTRTCTSELPQNLLVTIPIPQP